MQGVQSNFEALLADLKAKTQGAKFIAIDAEFTGTSLDGRPDRYEDDLSERLPKLLEIAERHALTQIGLTVARDDDAGCIELSTYCILAFPGDDRASFLCQAKSLEFLRLHGLDFNRWIDEGVRCICREGPNGAVLHKPGAELPPETGLLRLWQVLVEAFRPLVFHTPLDLLFLLAAFERRRLPRDPKELAALVRKCAPVVYDTALLHFAVPDLQSKPRKLPDLYRVAKACHDRMHTGTGLRFQLEARTEASYGWCLQAPMGTGTPEHEAGYDSLLTAALFAYLWALVGCAGLKRYVDRLFLFQSCECLDLGAALSGASAAANAFADFRGAVLVGEMLSPDAQLKTVDKIGKIGRDKFFYRKMDEKHLLVFIRAASHEEAVKNARELGSAQVRWYGLEMWRNDLRARRAKVSAAAVAPATPPPKPTPRGSGHGQAVVAAAALAQAQEGGACRRTAVEDGACSARSDGTQLSRGTASSAMAAVAAAGGCNAAAAPPAVPMVAVGAAIGAGLPGVGHGHGRIRGRAPPQPAPSGSPATVVYQ